MAGVVSYTALSLLSVVDDSSLRREIIADLIRANESIRTERRDTIEAGVIQALVEAFEGADAAFVVVGEVTDRFNARHISEYGQSFSKKWIGGIIRQRLRLDVRRSHGVYVIPVSERSKIDSLAVRYGVASSDAAHENRDIRKNDNSHPSGTIGI